VSVAVVVAVGVSVVRSAGLEGKTLLGPCNTIVRVIIIIINPLCVSATRTATASGFMYILVYIHTRQGHSKLGRSYI